MKEGHPSVISAEPETKPEVDPERGHVAAEPSPDVPSSAPDAQDGRQRPAEGAEAALAEPDDSAPAVTHIQSATVGGRGGPRLGPYSVLSGPADGRYRLERAARRLCEELARDQGYESFADLPATRRGLTRRLAEVHVAASAMWAAGVTSGRLVDRWLDLTNAQNRLAQALGLERVLRPANVVTLDGYVREKYGARNGEGPATPADSADPSSSAAQRPAEAVHTAQEAREP